MARSFNAQELPPARLKYIKSILGDLLLCAPYGSGQDVEQTSICIMLKIKISRTDNHPAPWELYELIHFLSQATFAISGNLRFGWWYEGWRLRNPWDVVAPVARCRKSRFTPWASISQANHAKINKNMSAAAFWSNSVGISTCANEEFLYAYSKRSRLWLERAELAPLA